MATRDGVYASDHSRSVLRTHSWRTAANSVPYLLPHLHPAMAILDVGCGPGSITIDLARRVRRGHVTGTDFKEEPLVEARALAARDNVGNVVFKVADVHALPFEDGSFDVVHAHQVLQHIRDPIQALREMKRVTKKGGLVAVRESASMTWYPASAALTEWKDLHGRVARAKGSHPDPGSYLHVWAREAGFERAAIHCSAGTWCFSTPEEREWWSGVWAERVRESSFAAFAREGGHCGEEDLERIAEGWRAWGKDEDAWFSILHGQILCRV